MRIISDPESSDRLIHPGVHDRYVLDQILSGEMTEVVVEKIHDYLRSVGENIRAGRMKLEDFLIFKVCA